MLTSPPRWCQQSFWNRYHAIAALLGHLASANSVTNEWGWVSALDSEGRTIWIADAHRDDGRRYVVRADEKLTAFLELESATRAGGAILLDEQASFFKTVGL